MPTVIVVSPSEVHVDGSNFGAVADTIANNPSLASDVQIALAAWWTAAQADFATKLAAATSPSSAPALAAGEIRYSRLQLKAKLGADVWAAITAAAKTDAQVDAVLDEFYLADYISTTDTATQQGFQLLVAKGLITATLSAQILTGAS